MAKVTNNTVLSMKNGELFIYLNKFFSRNNNEDKNN